MEGNTAFQEALNRARQLAAKISQPGTKRPNDDGESDFSPDAKKIDLGYKLSAIKNSQAPPKPSKDQLYLNGTMFNGEKVLDLMIPGNKVGFVIGKGGEMIRNLQERSGAKMVVYQETNEAGDRDKQLRLSGPPDKVDLAKQLVNDLLIEKELELSNRNNKNHHHSSSSNNNSNNNNSNNNKLFTPLNEYGSSRITFFEYPVSPQLIGLVIGKGGETIRKIQADSGCKVQFDTTKVDSHGNKICQFTGPQDAVNRALDMVKEIIDQVTGGQGTVEEIRLVVPTSRTGTVIGRGGETIRALKQQSGCNIELDKNFQSDHDDKCFIIRGTAEKVVYAQQLVTEKVGGHATVLMNTLQNNPMYSGMIGGSSAAASAVASATDPNQHYNNYLTSQLYAANQLGGTSAAAAAAAAQQAYYWPQGSDQKSVQDQYALWAAYYAQYYPQQAAAANGGNGNGGGSSSASSAAAAAAAAAASSTATDPNSVAAAAAAYAAAGQDLESVYQQWIEYYTKMDRPREAKEMEQKLKEYQNLMKKQGGGDDNGSAGGGGDRDGNSD